MIIIRVSSQTNSCWCQKSTSVILEIFFEKNYYRFKIYFCSEGRYFIIDSDLQLLDKSLILETTTVTFDWGKN